MAKHKIVKFSDDGKVRVYITNDLSSVIISGNSHVDPDLSHVKGLPPECWAYVDGKIVPGKAIVNIKAGSEPLHDKIIEIDVIKDIKNEVFNRRQEQNSINDKLVGETFRIDKNISHLHDRMKALEDKPEKEIVHVKSDHKEQITKQHKINMILGIISIIALILAIVK